MLRALALLDISKIGDLFEDGRGRGWEELLSEKQDISPLTMFHFFRVRHALRDMLGEDMMEPPEVAPFSLMLRTESPCKIVSSIYSMVQGYRKNFYIKARLEWQIDLGVTLGDDSWRYCCEATQRISLN